MKKIGIMTFHRAVNYGACLQAYALKRTIEKMGYSCDVIDYRCDAIEESYYRILRKKDPIKTKIRKILTWGIQKERNKHFEMFTRTYLVGNECYTPANIGQANKCYDLFITGSDQVWSPICSNGDMNYFLEFVNDSHKKGTYAVSMGLKNDTFFSNPKVLSLIKDFNKIAVRELEAADRLKDILGNSWKGNILQCADPTFLLEKEDWNELISDSPIESGYILVYSLSMPNEVLKYAERLSQKTGKKIIYFTLNNLFTMKNAESVVNGSPEKFLEYIASADYVVTNSFHGTAFSLIFEKDFVTIKNSNPYQDNSRLIGILQMLGLDDRLLEYDTTKTITEEIDYNFLNKKIKQLAQSSWLYLKELIDSI